MFYEHCNRESVPWIWRVFYKSAVTFFYYLTMIFRRTFVRYVRLMAWSVLLLSVCIVSASYSEDWTFWQYFAQSNRLETLAVCIKIWVENSTGSCKWNRRWCQKLAFFRPVCHNSPRPSSLYILNVTAHPLMASVPITILLYNGPFLCGFYVPIKGLNVDIISCIIMWWWWWWQCFSIWHSRVVWFVVHLPISVSCASWQPKSQWCLPVSCFLLCFNSGWLLCRK